MRELSRGAVVVLMILTVLGGSQALAFWQDSGSASMSISSGSLASATALTATPECVLVLPRVTLGWTPTTSTQAVGYYVYRRTGAGAYSQIATVTGRTSSGYVDLTVGLGTGYTYYVQAYVNSWTASSATASATTAAVCL